jgi:ribosomal protein S14
MCPTNDSIIKSIYGLRTLFQAQAVSRWLPTAAARVRARVSCGICGGQRGARAGFLRVLRFPLPIFIQSIAPQSPASIIWG